MLHGRRARQNNIIDNQTSIQQKNSSLFMKSSDRLRVQRTDQIYLYPRRIYRRNNRYNPYSTLTSLDQQQKNVKIENQIPEDLPNHSSEHLINGEISSETVGNLTDDQVVIPNEHNQSMRSIKQRIPPSMNNHCANCQQKFKTKHQFNVHLSKCQSEMEPR